MNLLAKLKRKSEPELISFEEFIKDFSYKPGHRFSYGTEESDAIFMTFDAPDRVTGLIQPFTAIRTLDRDKFSAEKWLEHLRSLIHFSEIHEADEFLTYKGERPFDPHKDES